MIPERLCDGGKWRACADCWRNLDRHEEIDPRRIGRPIAPDSCHGTGYYLPMPVKSPEDRL